MRHSNFYESQKIVDFAMSHGQNYFETCYFYLNYNCENYVYNLLKNYDRNEYEICGKLPLNFSDYKKIFQEQLNKVPKKYFDYYILQAVSYNNIYYILKNDIINFFIKEKIKGNIKNFGISIQCNSYCLKQLLDLYQWDIIQMPLNYFDWFISNEIQQNYKLIEEKNIPIIAQAPLKQGMLIQKMNNLFSNGCSLMDNAYCFLNSLQLIKYILCGTSTFNHYQENFYSFQRKNEIKYNYNDYKKVIEDYKINSFINCVNCLRCIDECPQHIPIPMYFQLYNKSLNNNTSFNDLQIIKESLNEPIQICLENKCDCSFIKGCPFNNNIKNILANQIFSLKV